MSLAGYKIFRLSFILVILFCVGQLNLHLNAQTIPDIYWVSFTDKHLNEYRIESPSTFLSQKSIQRREKQHISIDSTDLPVTQFYADSLRRTGIKVLNTSKWLNGVAIQAPGDSLLSLFQHISFLKKEIKLIKSIPSGDIKDTDNTVDKFGSTEIPVYGYSANQIEMVKGDYLHNQGFEGEGMLIAIEDLSSLQAVWAENRVLAVRDFTNDSLNIFKAHSHGSNVFSILAGVIDGSMHGVAINASYLLLRTENGDANYEYPVEEYNWVCGAEFADSIGADIINTSLGYSTFKDNSMNYSYDDMNGSTTPSSIGAGIAVSKGMVVVVSAGNEGDDPWFHISTPADAKNILTIGAVDANGTITPFSSRGPSADQRIKPDVCAQGGGTVLQQINGTIVAGSGTSFSAPLISGITACLWQANPNATSLQVMQSVRESGWDFHSPNPEYGYGIADFQKADKILKHYLAEDEGSVIQFGHYPNPATESLSIEISKPTAKDGEKVTIEFFDLIGNIALQRTDKLTGSFSILNIDLPQMATGFYTIRLEIDNRFYSLPLQIAH
jgi:serine protease AprX